MGEVGDELARATRDFEAIDEHTFQIEGSMHIEEANEQLDLELPPGDYETVAGFVLSLTGHIPREGEKLSYESLKLVITEMKGKRISKILIAKEHRDDATPAT